MSFDSNISRTIAGQNLYISTNGNYFESSGANTRADLFDVLKTIVARVESRGSGYTAVVDASKGIKVERNLEVKIGERPHDKVRGGLNQFLSRFGYDPAGKESLETQGGGRWVDVLSDNYDRLVARYDSLADSLADAFSRFCSMVRHGDANQQLKQEYWQSVNQRVASLNARIDVMLSEVKGDNPRYDDIKKALEKFRSELNAFARSAKAGIDPSSRWPLDKEAVEMISDGLGSQVDDLLARCHDDIAVGIISGKINDFNTAVTRNMQLLDEAAERCKVFEKLDTSGFFSAVAGGVKGEVMMAETQVGKFLEAAPDKAS